jgi:drug/metabolite transporter (DMT)-like permease
MKHYVIALVMVVTGITNLVCVKYSDTLKSENLDGNIVPFNQPFLTTWGLFLGQIIASVLFYIGKCIKNKFGDQRLENSERPQPYNPLIFWPLAGCEMLSAYFQYKALIMTYPALLQILRGSSILLTGLLSTFACGHPLKMHRWIGIAFLICGFIALGVCDISEVELGPHIHGISY